MADLGDIKDELDDINRSLEKLYDILYPFSRKKATSFRAWMNFTESIALPFSRTGLISTQISRHIFRNSTGS